MQRRGFWFSFLLYLLLSNSLLAQRGAITRPNTLEQLTAESTLAVHGFIVASKVEPHPDLPSLSTVVVDINVVDVLKGSAAKHVTFRQYIWDIRDRMDASGYRKGQEVVLLLGPESKLGLRSPVGLEQGKFRIFKAPDGKQMAVNGTGNRSLFTETAELTTGPTMKKSSVKVSAALQSNPSGLTLDELKRLVRAYAGGR